MKNKNLYLKLFAVFSFLASAAYCFFAINVTKKLNNNDIKSIRHLNIDNYCQELNSFEKEIKCIKKIQNKQLNIVKLKDCRKNFLQAGGLEFIKSNSACCFDRSRFMEQAFKYYGFKTKHVFLIGSNHLGIFSIFFKNNSHAVSEVLTSKGWLGVESNYKMILLDDELNVNSYEEVLRKRLLEEFTNEKEILIWQNRPILYVTGLYSRNGTFYKPYIPYFPEINFQDFFGNLPIKFINKDIVNN